MTHPLRTWRQHLARTIAALLVFMSPAFADRLPLAVVPVAMGALLAFDGLDETIVSWSVALMVLMELVWGINVGTLSLAYLGTALILRMAQRFVALIPMSHEDDWSPGALGRVTVVAWVLGLVMIAGSLAIQWIIYRHGTLALLAISAYLPFWNLAWQAALGALAVLILLHRIDVPFRRRIRFGI